MSFKSINPANGELVFEAPAWSDRQLQHALSRARAAAGEWAARPLGERTALLTRAGELLEQRRDELAGVITREMGKISKEARAEIEKCAWVCRHYAEQAERYLADEPIRTDAGKSYVAYQPLGTVLAVMPWNFPFWQVFRFAAPALAAGNTGLLKHASNVGQCALGIEGIFSDAGMPDGVFVNLMISSSQVDQVIQDPRVQAATLTGSEGAGRAVARQAGANLKKTVLELGGSDPFIVLPDADLDVTVQNAVVSRYLNAGQSCIAAKRFIVSNDIADEFLERFKAAVEALRPGDPSDDRTTLAPMARGDLRDELHQQVEDALSRGARAVTGCKPIDGPGFHYQASIVDGVKPGMRAYTEELFGPVASVLRARDDEDAIRIANESSFGLGGSVWTGDVARGESVARRLQCGAAFVNGMVKSDPRLPFGGVKHSGYGRELSVHGIREFVNVKTIWIA